MALNPTTDQQAHLIESVMTNPETRLHVAYKMMPQIQKERDYVSIGRQGFVLDKLAQGDVPYYDVDIKTQAVVLSKRGEVPQIRANVDRVEVPIFPLAAYPMVPIEDTRMRRFNVIDRVMTKTRADLAEEEDRLIFGDLTMTNPTNPDIAGQTQNKKARSGLSLYAYATDATTTTDPNQIWSVAGEDAFGTGRTNTTAVSSSGVTRDVLVEVLGEVIKHDLIPDAFIMNPRDYVDIYTWGRDEFDPETQKEIRETGRMGRLWNCEIHISKICPPGTVYCRTSDYAFGVMPILIDLDVMDSPDPKGLNYGFVFYEFIGMAILNRWGVAKALITRT
jgi:hypothetical protein